MAIIKLGEALKDFTPTSKNGRKDFAFNLGKQGIAQQNGKVVGSSEWFKENCEKEEHCLLAQVQGRHLEASEPDFLVQCQR